MTVMASGYLILSSMEILRFYFSVFSFIVKVSIEKIYQTRKTMFDHISKMFSTLFSVLGKCDQTRSFAFHNLHLPQSILVAYCSKAILGSQWLYVTQLSLYRTQLPSLNIHMEALATSRKSLLTVITINVSQNLQRNVWPAGQLSSKPYISL